MARVHVYVNAEEAKHSVTAHQCHHVDISVSLSPLISPPALSVTRPKHALAHQARPACPACWPSLDLFCPSARSLRLAPAHCTSLPSYRICMSARSLHLPAVPTCRMPICLLGCPPHLPAPHLSTAASHSCPYTLESQDIQGFKLFKRCNLTPSRLAQGSRASPWLLDAFLVILQAACQVVRCAVAPMFLLFSDIHFNTMTVRKLRRSHQRAAVDKVATIPAATTDVADPGD
ncbi:hypothetical protein GGX14DRAFT_570249 [Mycena pura]|uniref:Uncharacterized protein n=1 Tax=Mycena pura TaxID=153505 RepID=A0AAD6Y7E1_9AGAR|nr:hypothetical protein GGX14DRAFT_570249 [Mycena pura]